MDLISAIAAAASIVTLGDILYRICKKLWKYAKGVGKAATEAAHLYNTIFDFTQLLTLVEDTLDSAGIGWQPSPVFLDVKSAHLRSAKVLTAHLWNMMARHRDLLRKGPGNFFRKLWLRKRWVRMKAQVDEFVLRIEMCKSSLSMLLQIAMFERLRKCVDVLINSRDRDVYTIERLKKKISSCEKRIKVSRRRTEQLQLDCQVTAGRGADDQPLSDILAAVSLTIKVVAHELDNKLVPTPALANPLEASHASSPASSPLDRPNANNERSQRRRHPHNGPYVVHLAKSSPSVSTTSVTTTDSDTRVVQQSSPGMAEGIDEKGNWVFDKEVDRPQPLKLSPKKDSWRNKHDKDRIGWRKSHDTVHNDQSPNRTR